MARFVDKRIMKWFLTQKAEKNILNRLLAGTSAALFKLLGHVLEKNFEDIAVFFTISANYMKDFKPGIWK